jgi:ectoine hydroxylase-related dioxygenase (phytanoyl-CoA dioxygenase family)
MTARVNVVRPGGKAQTAHCDDHMGFQTVAQLRDYPASQHALSACLALQGAIADSDRPIGSGPTKLLPCSQGHLPGLMAVHLRPFRKAFEERFVQTALGKGDLLFFNPATFHAAGDNRTDDVHCFAKLLRIGSAYGRSIEIVGRSRMVRQVYPMLRVLAGPGGRTAAEIKGVIAATAEGYAFPGKLDFNSPLGGMAPPSQQGVLREALAEG